MKNQLELLFEQFDKYKYLYQPTCFNLKKSNNSLRFNWHLNNQAFIIVDNTMVSPKVN